MLSLWNNNWNSNGQGLYYRTFHNSRAESAEKKEKQLDKHCNWEPLYSHLCVFLSSIYIRFRSKIFPRGVLLIFLQLYSWRRLLEMNNIFNRNIWSLLPAQTHFLTVKVLSDFYVTYLLGPKLSLLRSTELLLSLNINLGGLLWRCSLLCTIKQKAIY